MKKLIGGIDHMDLLSFSFDLGEFMIKPKVLRNVATPDKKTHMQEVAMCGAVATIQRELGNSQFNIDSPDIALPTKHQDTKFPESIRHQLPNRYVSCLISSQTNE
jgi:hypothetical protein